MSSLTQLYDAINSVVCDKIIAQGEHKLHLKITIVPDANNDNQNHTSQIYNKQSPSNNTKKYFVFFVVQLNRLPNANSKSFRILFRKVKSYIKRGGYLFY